MIARVGRTIDTQLWMFNRFKYPTSVTSFEIGIVSRSLIIHIYMSSLYTRLFEMRAARLSSMIFFFFILSISSIGKNDTKEKGIQGYRNKNIYIFADNSISANLCYFFRYA